MKKIFYAMVLLSVTACFVAACSDDEPNNDGGNTDIEEVVPGTNHKILVAYFSEPLPDGVDAVTSASRVIVDGDLYGSVQYVATVIREATGGDMVRIQTAQPYPGNFDDLADQANNERQNDIHPALATEIDNFDDFTAEKDGTPFAAISELRYETLPAANAALAAVTATGTVEVVDVQRREVSQEPPLLYDLTALQKEANGRYGFSADKTLSVAQSLYEKKVLSYPRTGSRYLSDDVFDEIPDRIALLERYPAFAAHAAALKGASLNRRSVDAGKVTDHHALIITECLPGELSADERTVYDMVAARLLESFSARCLKDVTTVSFTAGNSVFTAKGTVVRSAGWRAVRNERDEDDEGTAALPPLQPGESFPLQSAECVEKQTKPRPLHTESSLLSAMEHCGRELQDDELRDSLKGNGIGTPATRASIIETLFARDYVRREKRSLVPTDKGLAVYQIVKDKRIADVEMTGQWETALAKIESGEMNPDTFRKGIEVYAAQITEELLQVQVSVADGGHIPCPKCRSGRILLYPKVAKCSNVDCGLTVFRNKGEKQLTDSQIADLVTKGKTSLIKGFRSREGKPFDAYLTFDKDFRTVYGFPPRTDKPKGKERRR